MSQSKTNTGERKIKRIFVRVPVDLVLSTDAGPVQSNAFTVDFTEHGVGIETQAKLEVGQIVVVIPNAGMKYSVRSRVVWARVSESGPVVKAGLEFTEPVAGDWRD